jgi:peptidoglycan/xylan/chitin deacetylase (PgdA/CDA1 family)
VSKRQQRRYVQRRSEYSLGRRRRRRARRQFLFVVLVIVLGLAITAGVMAASAGKSGRGGNAAGGRPVAPVHPAAARQETRAARAVLRYVPTIAAGSRQRRVIALTFDDGPSPYTPKILRVLERMHVPATFFVVGQQLRYFSDAVREEVQHGFTIGDHTENHAWLLRLNRRDQTVQIDRQATAVRRLGAPAPSLFRPPYGAYNGTTLRILKRTRMLMVLWSIDPGDWRLPGVKWIVGGVLKHARPGAIVILHDGGGNRSETVAALPQIIRQLRRRGYELVSVPQLLVLDPPSAHQRLPSQGAA